MKTLLVLAFSCLCFISCSDDSDLLSSNTEMNYREIAYESLSEWEKGSITIDWREAEVSQGVYKKDSNNNAIVVNSESEWYFLFKDTNTELDDNHLLIAVSFNTTYDSLLGPIILIIDPKSETVIGFMGRE